MEGYEVVEGAGGRAGGGSGTPHRTHLALDVCGAVLSLFPT